MSIIKRKSGQVTTVHFEPRLPVVTLTHLPPVTHTENKMLLPGNAQIHSKIVTNSKKWEMGKIMFPCAQCTNTCNAVHNHKPIHT